MSEQTSQKHHSVDVELPEVKEGQVIVGFSSYNDYLTQRRDMVGHTVYLLGMVFTTLQNEGIDQEDTPAIAEFLDAFKEEISKGTDKEGEDFYRRICTIISTWFIVPISEELVLIDDVTVEAYRSLVAETEQRQMQAAAEKIQAIRKEQDGDVAVEITDTPKDVH